MAHCFEIYSDGWGRRRPVAHQAADSEIDKWVKTTGFRRALSLSIDRDPINEPFWLRTRATSSVVAADHTKYNPRLENRRLWATHKLDKANAIQDRIGLDQKDADDYRLRAGGKGQLRLEIFTIGGQFRQFTHIAEIIREPWRKIG
jgi:ABC-type transport system substrate-binding protein